MMLVPTLRLSPLWPTKAPLSDSGGSCVTSKGGHALPARLRLATIRCGEKTVRHPAWRFGPECVIYQSMGLVYRSKHAAYLVHGLSRSRGGTPLAVQQPLSRGPGHTRTVCRDCLHGIAQAWGAENHDSVHDAPLGLVKYVRPPFILKAAGRHVPLGRCSLLPLNPTPRTGRVDVSKAATLSFGCQNRGRRLLE